MLVVRSVLGLIDQMKNLRFKSKSYGKIMSKCAVT